MMRPAASLATLAALLALGACATKTELQPAPGMDLPPTPFGSSVPSDAEALLDVPTQAVPTRSEELRVRSEPREDDPFDLPPE